MNKYKTPKSYIKEIKPRPDKTLGYLYFMDKEHPLADKKGRIWHHRHVASIKIGRWVSIREEVHHKDEDRGNNNEDNLDVFTTTKEHQQHHAIERGHKLRSLKQCKYCKKEFMAYNQQHCSTKCQGLSDRKFNISKKDLEKLVWEKPTVFIAKQFGVSDSAIGRRCKILEIQKPPRGYWAKIHPGKKYME